MIDSHCHITSEKFDTDRADVIQRAWDAGLTQLISIGAGNGMEDNHKAIALAASDPRIYATVGLHPHDADQFTDETIAELEALAQHTRVVAIGETGLDYHYDFADRDKQAQAFRAQVALAQKLSLPFVIHNRESDDDLFTILDTFPKPLAGILHCFTSDRALAQRALSYGLHISVPGVVTFKKADAIREALPHIPRDRLLIETDAPYLAPVPYRGKRNEPSYVVETAKVIADTLGMPLDEFSKVTTENTVKLFGLSS
jgi:TatD DNase family protein